ncbi:MAG TPA: pinensin family lanthipeptide [Longimicrobium sp.]|nr:pinensin family lanthipeptide [Longimicrobium sp.]
MSKKLSLDALAVESFETILPPSARGTVQAHSDLTTSPESCDFYCPSQEISGCCTGDPTCPASCNATCAGTCPNTCRGVTCGAGCGETEPMVCPY